MKILSIVAMLIAGLFLFSCGKSEGDRGKKILVFSKTEGFRHSSIPDGIAAFQKMGEEYGFMVDTTENAEFLREDSLKQYDAVVFLNTTGDVLNHYQQIDFQRYIQAGGGFMGVHAAADTEYGWPWYGRLVGAYFKSHPEIQEALVRVVDHDHPATDSLPDEWVRTDEWYNYYNINENVTTLAELDETSYEGGENPEFHPIAWYHEYDGGRAFYTGGGHTAESYSEPLFLKHLWGGLSWLFESTRDLNYARVTTERVPEENRFTQVILDQVLNEPTELEVLNDHRVIFTERHGAIKMYDPALDSTLVIGEIPVFTEMEDGLMGMALDPAFDDNHWIYFYYSPVGDEPKQHLSRFRFTDNRIDIESEQVLLVVPTQRDECCHTGGSIEFDARGNLYLSTGDDTNPFGTSYAPIDDRPGRKPWDARRTSANTNDLRGKILRIHPEEDGSYTIPEGNLFAEGMRNTRPEIYVMGNRNPYRISIDQKTGFLYWGEIGPDAGEDSTGHGPRGYDEINQARESGNFGWPLFIANNQAYMDYDFTSGKSGPKFNPKKPTNNSAYNTGLTDLPPTREAFIWYPYGPSVEFPSIGQGGRSAMAGPVYYHDRYREREDRTFPSYYDGKLFIYEWMRNWIKVVTMDEAGNFLHMEPFMPSHEFIKPIDMQFAEDGSLYVLEYGTDWNKENEDARLIRIEYNSGNRPPVVMASLDRKYGKAPHTVRFTTEGTTDYDGDPITYEWVLNKSTTVNEPSPEFTYEKAGTYHPRLTVSDDKGNTSTRTFEVVVGNDPPVVSIALSGNQTFYWDNQEIRYQVQVKDTEDGILGEGIDPASVVLTRHYLPAGFDETEIATGHREVSLDHLEGQKLMAESDCASCHQINEKSIGPTYLEVAERYGGDPDAVPYLVNKIIKGGGGVWGEQVMAAHPQLDEENTGKIVKYILSLDDDEDNRIPLRGTFIASDHLQDASKGKYYLRATYVDSGANGIDGIPDTETRILRYYQLPAASATVRKGSKFSAGPIDIVLAENGTEILLEDIDLTGISTITLNGWALGSDSEISLSVDDSGALVQGFFKSLGIPGPQEGTFVGQGALDVSSLEGIHDILLQVANTQGGPAVAFSYFVFDSAPDS